VLLAIAMIPDEHGHSGLAGGTPTEVYIGGVEWSGVHPAGVPDGDTGPAATQVGAVALGHALQFTTGPSLLRFLRIMLPPQRN